MQIPSFSTHRVRFIDVLTFNMIDINKHTLKSLYNGPISLNVTKMWVLIEDTILCMLLKFSFAYFDAL